MYMILYWIEDDSYLTCLHNEDGSIMLWESFKEASKYAGGKKFKDDLRVISIEE